MVRHSNYWFETCPTKRTVTSGLVRNIDVLVIGGGVAGISLLYQLINSGLTNSYLVEESTVGFHASGRSSGQLMLRGSRLFSELPEDDGREYLEFIGENNRRFLNGLRSVRFDTDLRESGGLRLAISDDEMQRLAREAEFIKEHRNIDCPILSKRDVHAILPSPSFKGGIFVPNESTFNPYKVVNGLRELIEHNGLRVLTDSQVESVQPNANGGLSVSIRHKGVISTKKVVYCTNAYTPELLPELADHMTSFRGQMVSTDYLPDPIASILPVMSMTCNNCHEYFRLHGGRLLVGGKRQDIKGQQLGITYDGEISPAVFEKLRAFVGEALPFIDTKFTHTWSGIMCGTADGFPLIGPVPGRPNEYIMAGFNGYGFSHALFGAMIIKDYLKTGQSSHPGARLFDPARLEVQA